MTSGVLGVLAAAAVVRLLPVLAPDVPRIQEVRFDVRAVLFALVATGIATLASGGPAARRRIQLRPADMLSGTASRTMSAAVAHDCATRSSWRRSRWRWC